MLAKTAEFLSKVKALTGETSAPAVSSPDDWPSREELAAEERRLQALGVDTTSSDDGTKPRDAMERYEWTTCSTHRTHGENGQTTTSRLHRRRLRTGGEGPGQPVPALFLSPA